MSGTQFKKAFLGLWVSFVIFLAATGAVSAAEYSETILAPYEVTRSAGIPETVDIPFSAPFAPDISTYTLTVENTTDEGPWIEILAWFSQWFPWLAPDKPLVVLQVWLNGDASGLPIVLSDSITRTLSLQQGSNILHVKMQGGVGESVSVSIVASVEDSVPPTITAAVSPQANEAGWHNVAVQLSYTCEDDLSGIAQCPSDQTISTEGAVQVFEQQAVDAAGNVASVSTTLSIDLTPPVLGALQPSDGALLTTLRPDIQFSAQDLAINPASAAVMVDGVLKPANCTLSVGQVHCVLAADLPVTASLIGVTLADLAGHVSTLQSNILFDFDNDGVAESVDLCPATPAGEAVDANGCAESQKDDDADGVNNALDQCPQTEAGVEVDASGCPVAVDADNDGVLDNIDQCLATEPGTAVAGDGCDPSQRDSDGDGVLDYQDAFPHDATETSDLDGDGIGDNSDTDRDGDGVDNATDAFADDANEWSDFDNDGVGDNTDTDRDNDGVPNDQDPFPLDPTRSSLPQITITSPQSLMTLGASPVTVTGTVDTSAANFTVNGAAVAFDSNGNWSTPVHLEEGYNTIAARMVDAEGIVSTASVSISLDLTPPFLTIESHQDQQVVYQPTVAISGLVNDIVRGTIEASQAMVVVNGIEASIRNRTYLAEGVTLQPGANLITVRGTDQAGNIGEKTLTLNYQPAVGKKVEILSGQAQQALVDSLLPQPLKVTVLNDQGQAVTDASVVFRVVQGSGVVGMGTAAEAQAVLVDTNGQGVAETQFKVGQRAGQGLHKVSARVVGYDADVTFYASALPASATTVGVNSGNNQRGALYQPLPAPLVVTVTDERRNRVANAAVRFRVIKGGGIFQNGEPEWITQTDSDGRATTSLTLGGQTGLDQQWVRVSLLDANDSEVASTGFTASGFYAGDAGDTSISGVVVDNQDVPLPGVTVRVRGTSRTAVADATGAFQIENVPVGPVHLIADGSTADAEGEYPNLSYNLVTVSGVDNPLSRPIYMVKLNEANKVWAGAQDAVVTLPELPGFKLEVPAGSVTFLDGSREGYISVTSVNANTVPKTPPDGMQPQVVVTIQPSGALFDPPARMTMPNVDGYAPGAQVELISFDHDIEEFVSIGLATVSRNGAVMESNPGVGVVKAGWHLPPPPAGTGGGGSGDCTGTPEQCKGNPEDSEKSCPTGGTNPINLTNGNKYQTETDFVGVGPFPLAIERTYSSLYNGWHHNYQYSVRPATASEVASLYGNSLSNDDFSLSYRLLAKADGSTLVYQKDSSGAWASSSDPYGELEESSAGYVYRDTRTGKQMNFDGQGRLTRIQRSDGHIQTLQYVESNVVVTDDLGNIMTLTFNANGQLSTAAVEDLQFSYAYDDADNLSAITWPDGTTKQYVYEDPRWPNHLTGIVDEAGLRYASWQYDKYGRAILSEHGGNNAERKLLRYNDFVRENDEGTGEDREESGSVTVTNELDRQSTFYWQRIAGKRRITRIDGHASLSCPASGRETTYTDTGLVETRTDWEGNISEYDYDDLGRKISKTEAKGTAVERTTAFTYDDASQPLETVRPGGRVEARTYNADGKLHALTVGDRTTTYDYYPDSGLLKSLDGPRTDVNDITSFGYDELGRMASVTNALNQTVRLENYSVWNQPQTRVDANGVTTELDYDLRGRLVKSTLKSRDGDVVTQYGVDARGLVTSITPPSGATINYEYDDARRLIAIENPRGERIEYVLDAMGNRVEENVRGGGGELVTTHRRVFDELGRLLQDIGAAAQTTQYTYDNNDNVTATVDPRGNAFKQAFDPLQRLYQSEDPYQSLVQYGYDQRDNLISVTDQRGLSTTYSYNEHNQVETLTSPDTGVTTFTYDKAGNIATRTDARNVTAQYSYDVLNRLRTVTYADDPTRNIVYLYDQSNTDSGASPENYNAGIGRLTTLTDHSGTTTFRYDDRGNVLEDKRTVKVGDTDYTYTVQYQYDLSNRLITLIYPDGTETTYAYNALGEVTGIEADIAGDFLSTTLAENISYQPFGPIKQLTWGNGLTLSRTFDQDGRLVTQRISSIQDLTYGFDDNSNITSILDGIDETYNFTYGYDKLNRLAQDTSAQTEYEYRYDVIGNREEKSTTDVANNTATTESYTYAEQSNRLATKNATTYQYDQVGNTLNDGEYRYQYDATNRMNSASSASNTPLASYRYNAMGQRTVKKLTQTGESLVFAYGQSGQLLSELTFDASNVLIERKHFVWLGMFPVAQLQPDADDSDYEVLYLHPDHLNTPRKASNDDDVVVWQWNGEVFGAAEANDDPDNDGTKTTISLRFPGQYHDGETKMNYNYFRDYDPSTGRYVQSDPIGLGGGGNTYAYVSANPLIFTDEFGLANRLCGPGSRAVPAPDIGSGAYRCVPDGSDPNEKICVTGNCAAGLPPADSGEPISCEAKCNFWLGAICGPVAGAFTETGPGAVAAYAACRAAVYVPCKEACDEGDCEDNEGE